MAIKHTKSRQWVWNSYQDPIRFHPAKVLEFGYIKIQKYPQEMQDKHQQWNDYDGMLFTIVIRRPRWRPIGRWHFDLHINNGEGLIQKTIKKLKRILGIHYEIPNISIEDLPIPPPPTTIVEDSDSVF